ncbi:hypothetical protein DEAC_c23200 [Desulfosporosinus acididurans]|uniref:Uncharacterized protein n=1 Tax=Desulfosporosinus acididurans TaxID=476652 RepID=A0A0J1FQB7_9FIRM|nr:hypothetical protein [Desulfosporosinus acididurans]KLU65690.1 hypothetical protein DEAC_c23200 [Desulfosporosinus acididurans]
MITVFDFIYNIIILLGFICFLWLAWMFYDTYKRLGYDENGNQVVWKRKYWKDHKKELKALTERIVQERLGKERT